MDGKVRSRLLLVCDEPNREGDPIVRTRASEGATIWLRFPEEISWLASSLMNPFCGRGDRKLGSRQMVEVGAQVPSEKRIVLRPSHAFRR